MATSAERLKQYEDLYEQRKNMQDIPSFQQDFEKDYLAATDYNKDLINQQSSALGKLQAVAPEMRERYLSGPVLSPSQQRNLIAQARQNPISDWSQAVNLLQQRGSRLSDIMRDAVTGYQAQLNASDTDIENAWRLYQDAVQQEQFNRQNRPGPSIEEILANLPGGDDLPPNNDDGPDITVDDRTWNQKLLGSKIGGYDINSEKYQQLSPLRKYTTLLNPLTGIKTFGGIAGDLIARARLGDKYILDRGKTGSRGSTW